jgi:DNA-directed RNA polymerase subunit E"
MTKKKVCKACKMFVDGAECPVCHGQSFSTNFQGRIFIVDPEKSEVAKKIGLAHKGEYAIKAR